MTAVHDCSGFVALGEAYRHLALDALSALAVHAPRDPAVDAVVDALHRRLDVLDAGGRPVIA